jgi:[ribosomal protein S5]-alanine N-acetyltransferase
MRSSAPPVAAISTGPAAPIDEADPDTLRPARHRPSTRGPYLPPGFRSPHARRRRWEKDGWLGGDFSQLAVALPDGTLAGIVSWRSINTGGPETGCLESGALLFPEHRGKGLGTAVQRLLAQYLFATTLANRLQAITDVENIAEQKALERAGFRREGIMRGLAFDRGRWQDGVLYARAAGRPRMIAASICPLRSAPPSAAISACPALVATQGGTA